MTNALPYFKFYGKDFISGTTRMSAAARWHYLALLWAQWEGGALPADLKVLDRISPGVRRCWDEIKDKFETRPEGLVNARLERERTEVEGMREFNHNRAKAAAEARHSRRRTGVQAGRISYSAAAQSSAPGMLQACSKQCSEQCSEQCLEQCSKSANSEGRRQKTDHPTHSGGGGPEGVGGEFATEAGEPGIPPVEAMHASAAAARSILVQRRGEAVGIPMFEGAVRSRIRQIRGLYTHFGVSSEQVLERATAEAMRWPWDAFDSRLTSLRREAETKHSPAGWLVSKLQQPTESPNLRLAAASA